MEISLSEAHDQDFDVLDLLETLWQGKWSIALSTCLLVLMGFVFLALFQNTKPNLKAEIKFSNASMPPFFYMQSERKFHTFQVMKSEYEEMFGDYRDLFYDEPTFEEWQKQSDNKILKFTYFTDTQIIEGYKVSRDPSKQQANLNLKKDPSGFSIIIKSGELPLIDSYYSYSKFVNMKLGNSYVEEAEEALTRWDERVRKVSSIADEQLKEIKSRFKLQLGANQNISSAQQALIDTQLRGLSSVNFDLAERYLSVSLNLDTYIAQTSKKGYVYTMERPNLISTGGGNSPVLILSMFTVIGLLFGSFYVVIKNAFQNRWNSRKLTQS